MGLTPFKVATGVQFVPMPEYPRDPPSSVSLTEWVGSLQNAWGTVKQVLAQAAETQKVQADKRQSLQKPFHVGEKVYFSTKYLKLKLPCRKLGPEFIGPFPIVKIITPVTVELKLPQLLGKVHPVFHSSFLKPVVGSELRPIAQIAPKPMVVVVGEHIMRLKGFWILVVQRQTAVPSPMEPIPKEARWVKVKDMKADQLIRKFHEKYPQKPKESSQG